MSNISPKQFGPPTRSVPMPTKPPGGSFGRVGPTPVAMPTKPPGGSFGSNPSGMRSVPMPTKPPSGGFSGSRPAPMPTRVFGR